MISAALTIPPPQTQIPVASNPVIRALAERYRADTMFYVEHALGHWTWSKQREILQAVLEHERVAVRACHSVSKTFTAAELVVWFFNVYPNSKVITTAPVARQVEELLWTEIAKTYRTSRIRLHGECQTVKIKSINTEHYAIGFSTDNADSAEGFHAPQLLYIFDEAKGIDQWMYDAADGALTGGFCRWLQISTTDGVAPGSPFHRAFMHKDESTLWHRIHISAMDSPLITGEQMQGIAIEDPTRPDRFRRVYGDARELGMQLPDANWISKRKIGWGEGSVMYQTKVLGEIVDVAIDTIFPLHQVSSMFARWDNPEARKAAADGAIEVGADIARSGDDDIVMFKRKGMCIIGSKTIHTSEVPDREKLVWIAHQIAAFAGHDCQRLKVDDTGVGGGVTDVLQGINGFADKVVPINFSSKSSMTDKYPDIISEMWFECAGVVHSIACPEDNRLQSELTSRKQVGLDKQGRRVVEPKKAYKARGYKSPDAADAFLLTFYNPAPAPQFYARLVG